MPRFIAGLGLLCGLYLLAPAVQAEDCTAAKYPLTAAEKGFFSTFVTLRNAAPKPPAGWQLDDDSKELMGKQYTYLPASECDITSYVIHVGVKYVRPMTEADAAAEQKAMQAKPDPAKQKKVDQIMAQQQALMQKITAASQKQDYKALDALGKQSDELNAELQAAQADLNAATAAKIAAIERDRDASVDINVNDGEDLTCYGSPKPLQIPGASVAYSCESPATFSSPGEQLDPAQGRIVVVFGPVSKNEVGDWDRMDNSGKHYSDHNASLTPDVDGTLTTVVQNVTVVISGNDLARAQSLFKQMDLKPLAGLVQKR